MKSSVSNVLYESAFFFQSQIDLKNEPKSHVLRKDHNVCDDPNLKPEPLTEEEKYQLELQWKVK
jgi:hypothetical protein